MAKRSVNVVFITLLVLSVVGLLFGIVADILTHAYSYEEIFFLVAFIYPLVMLLVIGNELFLWRSMVSFVTYPGHRKIELTANILIAVAAIASFVYMVYVIFARPLQIELGLLLCALGLQFLCKLFTWFVGTVAICKEK